MCAKAELVFIVWHNSAPPSPGIIQSDTTMSTLCSPAIASAPLPSNADSTLQSADCMHRVQASRVAGSSSTSNTVFILLAALMGVLRIEALRNQTAQSGLWLHANSVALAYSMVVCGARALLARPLLSCFSRLHLSLALTAHEAGLRPLI